MFLFLILAFDVTPPPQCVIDRCEGEICTVETPEGFVEVAKKAHYKEGVGVVCPFWLIDPT